MWYQPKFCSECGEKIVRAEWGFWHSRQFCELCSTKHQVLDISGRFAVLVVPIIIIGFAVTAFMPGRTINQLQSTTPPARGFVSEGKRKELEPKAEIPSQPVIQTEQQKEGSVGRASVESPKIVGSADEVYFCGAPTKKGTPCTRRVKLKGFCWQHQKPQL